MSEIQVQEIVDENSQTENAEVKSVNTQDDKDLLNQVCVQQTKIQSLERDVQLRTEERENYKNKVHQLENEVKELKNQQPNTLNPAQQNEVDKIKKKSEELLIKAKGVIFEKTKLCKHQELQIEGLSEQVNSLKEVLHITKDLLEIRNMEVKHLQEKMDFMDEKINAEKVRHDLMHKKMDAVVELNMHLKAEHEAQLKLFAQLRSRYEERDSITKNAS